MSGKQYYANEEIAIEALIQHQIRNQGNRYAATNIYKCEDCGNWHFTSKGTHEVLEDPTVLSRIKKEKLAFQWEQKFR